MQTKLTLTRKGMIIIGGILLIQMVFLVVFGRLLSEAEFLEEKEYSSKEIIGRCNWLGVLFSLATLGCVDYVASGDKDALKLFKYCEKQWPSEMSGLHKAASKDVRQQEIVRQATVVAANLMNSLDKTLSKKNEKGESAVQERKAIKTSMSELIQGRHDLLELDRERFRVTVGSMPNVRNVEKQFLWLAAGFETLLALAVFYLYTHAIVRRLTVLADNATRFARGEKLHPLLEGSDEVAQVDSAFHAMAEDLAQADQRKQEFLRMISHDLRTPLTALAGSVTLLRSGRYGKLSLKGEQVLENADHSLNRLISMINELLDIERMEAGMAVISAETVYVKDLVSKAVASVRVLAGEKRVEIVEPITEAEIYADEGRLVQVLVNLLGNAIKFSPEGGNINIAVEESASSWEFSIADQGPGIPTEFLDKVFDRFQQVDSTDATVRGGSGLGLAIGKAIVQAHGGEIGVRSVMGQGSTFWFRLPKPAPVSE